MSTGGENEGDTVGGYSIAYYLELAQGSAARLLQALNEIRNQAQREPVRLDVQLQQGAADQLRTAAREAQQISREDSRERDYNLRERIRDERQLTIEREADLRRQQQQEVRLGRTRAMLSDVERGQYNPRAVWRPEDDEGTRATESNRIREGMTKRAAAEEAVARRMAKMAESGEKLDKWLEIWASGGRPQRAVAGLIQGPLTAMFGMEAGAAMAGLGGMIGGGALFHVGWAITDALSKIPQRIEQVYEQNLSLDVMRSRQLGGAGSEINALGQPTPWAGGAGGISSNRLDADYMARLGGGYAVMNRMDYGRQPGKEYQQGINTLTQKLDPSELTSPETIAIWAKRNASAMFITEFAKTFSAGGDPLTMAYAIQQGKLHRDPAAAETLIKNQPGVMEALVKSEKRFHPEWDMLPWAKQVERTRDIIFGARGLGSIIEDDRTKMWDTVLQAYTEKVFNPGALKAYKTAVGQTQPWTTFYEWLDKDPMFGTGEKLGEFDRNALKDYFLARKGGDPTKPFPIKPTIPEYDEKKVSAWVEQESHRWLRPGADRLRALIPAAEALLGNPSLMAGGLGRPWEMPGIPQQPRFSFSTSAEFADKMQREAGIQMTDFAEKTADNTNEIKAAVKSMDAKMGTATW